MSTDGSVLVSLGPPADASTRELWVDVPRGGAILLVILHHAWQTLSERVEVAQIWTLVDHVAFSSATAVLEGDSASEEARAVIRRTLTVNGLIWYLPALATFLELAFVLRERFGTVESTVRRVVILV